MAKDNPLVSVCIPAFNCEKSIGECLQSIINQTYPNIEIIVVDDGSTDGTNNAAKLHAHSALQIIHQPNKGAAVARNVALTIAKGIYIQFMDADDLLSPDKIEKQVTALSSSNDNAVAVCSTINFFDGTLPSRSVPSAYDEQFLNSTNDPVDFMIRLWGGYDFKGSMVQPNAWLTPKSLIDSKGSWNECLTLDDDGEFFARVVLNADRVVRTEGFNYYRKYQFSNDNLSSFAGNDGLQSLLESTLLKKKYLFELRSDDKALRAAYRQLIEVAMIAYLVSPQVFQCADAELKHLPMYKFKKNMGGVAINILAKMMGWKFAKRMQLLRKLYKYYFNDL
ncbi:glycosyltransferase family 2 protein [Mucilaginibacter aquaedulcis]|uniref:glycosyltransferase family 2 protein n=1 Tax=Mucilaginibacter aquaedulcis TaxID=1187081 RepID=UPI0025B3112B|nr:glycosyltransferase family A protein [Mucilaginibacter aquaedulcis]MDN3548739.1 glycosyltransferase family A protein [Mucilaginibacter aquaedulcis]